MLGMILLHNADVHVIIVYIVVLFFVRQKHNKWVAYIYNYMELTKKILIKVTGCSVNIRLSDISMWIEIKYTTICIHTAPYMKPVISYYILPCNAERPFVCMYDKLW